jgi:hypothetical protein
MTTHPLAETVAVAPGSPWQTRAALRAGLFSQIGVGKSRKISDIPTIFRLDLTENSSLSQAGDFHHGLLGSQASYS